MGVSDCLRMMSWMNSSRRSGNEAKDAPELSGKWLTMACQNRFVCHKRKMMFTWNNAPVKDVASDIIAGLRKANAPNLLTPSRQCWRMLSDACLPRRSTSDDARRRHDELFRNILVRLHHYALISQLMWFTGFLHEQFQTGGRRPRSHANALRLNTPLHVLNPLALPVLEGNVSHNGTEQSHSSNHHDIQLPS